MSAATSPADLRVAFAGTPEFAAVALRAIHAAGFQVPLILTQPDRPAGRGMKLQGSPVKQTALEWCVPVAQPRSLRLDGKYPEDAESAQQALLKAAPDVLVVAAYGLILPTWVLDLPRCGCLNIHASLLPRWRGAAPIHRAIEAGDAQTGITLMQMDEGLDTGAMLSMERLDIQPQHTTASLHDELAAMGGRMVVAAMQQLQATPLAATPQPNEGITYAHKIEKAEAMLDWSLSAEVIARRIRAFDPFPGVSFDCAGEPVKVWQAVVLPGLHGQPGQVLEASGDRFIVACGQGALAVQQVQRPGGRRVPVAAFLQGRPGLMGQSLRSAPDAAD
ncbi:MAG: methionyl-tRNA formyltransferase [Ideonella sp.]|nr:methionyl-tRNA formyltransferase [Ideonella sp.]